MECPFCGTSLETKMQGPVEYDQCGQCGSYWFDFTELQGYSEHMCQLYQAVEAQPDIAYRNTLHCPRDGTVLETRYFVQEDIELSSCPECYGLCVTQESLSVYLIRRGSQKPQPDPAQRTAERITDSKTVNRNPVLLGYTESPRRVVDSGNFEATNPFLDLVLALLKHVDT